MRGTVTPEFASRANFRITPAGAGNSLAAFFVRLKFRDHPRGCGEQIPAITVPAIAMGSPPRVRGTANSQIIKAEPHRITPAGAGNRVSTLHLTQRPWDHPRGCGEQSQIDNEDGSVSGSPPRVRGTVQTTLVRFAICRITPAGAGNSRILTVSRTI